MPKASSSASTSNLNSVPVIEAASTTQTVSRSHGKRSCQTCKKRKTRCELPKFDVPASPIPLSYELSCHRCKTLKIPCIVPDKLRGGNPSKKTKKQKLQEEEEQQLTDQASGGSSSRKHSPTPLLPLFEVETSNTLPSKSSSSNTVNNHVDRKMKPKERIFVLSYPLVLLSELIKRDAHFGKDLTISKDPSELYSIQQVLDLIRDPFHEMEYKLRVIMLHLPHLPSLTTLTSEFLRQPSLSLRLLLSTTILLTLPPNSPDKSKLQASLRSIIQQDLFSSIISDSRDIRSIQALQLIAVYSPITSVPGLDGSLSVSGSLCLSLAKSSAKYLGLDQSFDRLKSLQAASMVSHFSGNTNLDLDPEFKSLAERAIIWSSIQAWTGHFEAFEFSKTSTLEKESELEPHRLNNFTQCSNNVDEISARVAGCISTKHRIRLYRTFYSIKPELARAGEEMPEGELRGRALIEILDRSLPLLSRQSRDDDFASLTSDEYTQNIIAWSNFETEAISSSVTSLGTSALLKEAIAHIAESPARFFQAANKADASNYTATIKSRGRPEPVLSVFSAFKGLSSSNSVYAFGSPPRSTSAFVVLSINQFMEHVAASISLFRKLPPEFDSYLPITEEVIKLLEAMDPDETCETGSIPQASAKIVEGITDSLKLWKEKVSQVEGNSLGKEPFGTEPEAKSYYSCSNPSTSSQNHHLPPLQSYQQHPNSSLPSIAFSNHRQDPQYNSHQGSSYSNQHQQFGQAPNVPPLAYPHANFNQQQQQVPPPEATGPFLSDEALDHLLMEGLVFWPGGMDGENNGFDNGFT